jgi:DNA repair exonuclease SbcCD ATPase subunit
MDSRDRQASALRANAARKASAKRAATEAALQQLQDAGTPVTFAAVARIAGVSRTYLYKTPDLAERIRSLIADETEAAEAAGRTRSSTLGTRLRLRSPNQAALDSLTGRIRDLEHDLAASRLALEQLRRDHEQCPVPNQGPHGGVAAFDPSGP